MSIELEAAVSGFDRAMTAGPHQGKVYLLGAGPGDPGLLTLRAVECLARADVVLYDYLVNPKILEHARPGSRKICLGRHGGERIWTQREINRQMVQSASEGQVVARLKGGDPLIFGRAAEEVQALSTAGIDYEIVPGVTAGLAAGSYAGIPLTHRDVASAVALVTGQECPDKQPCALDFQALARFPGTLVFYMGVTTAAQWTAALIGAGRPADTPAAIVRKATLPDQQTIRCPLGEVAERLNGLRPPAVVIVGELAAADRALEWFERRPLHGQSILVTRPSEQAAGLADRLAELGAEVLIQPAIQIEPPPEWRPVDEAIERLAAYDWVVFSSANGVQSFMGRLFQHGDARRLAGCRLAAIGPGTADALRTYFLQVDLLPREYRAESLAAALADGAPGRRFLLVRASRGREVLAQQLQQAGGRVDQVVAYTSTDVVRASSAVHQRLAQGQVDWVTVTSSAIARSLACLFGADLGKAKLVSISPITSGVLRELGFSVAAEAGQYTLGGVVEAILWDVQRSKM